MMKRCNILLCLSNRQNTILLEELLGKSYDIKALKSINTPEFRYDLVVTDFPTLQNEFKQLQIIKEKENSVILPVLVVISRNELGLIKNYLEYIDELIITPVEKFVLISRIKSLLNTRSLSLMLKQKNSDQQTFMHALVHDIRNPLNYILNFSNLLKKEIKPAAGSNSENYLIKINTGINKISEIIESLLSFFRLDFKNIELSLINLSKLIEILQKELQEDIEKYQGKIITDFKAEEISTDLSLFKIILANLILNSLKYRKKESTPLIKISSYYKDNNINLEFSDNGIGIRNQDLDNIFTPFKLIHKRSDYKSVGLGLYTVKRIVNILKGTIEVESVFGKGTTFIIKFPNI